MIDIHDAIRALNPSIVTIREKDAFDQNENPVAFDQNDNQVSYDMVQAQAKLVELQAQEEANQQARNAAKASALAKLSALGLTAEEIKSITG